MGTQMSNWDEIENTLRASSVDEAQDMWRRAFDYWAEGKDFFTAWDQVIEPELEIEEVENSSNVKKFTYDVLLSQLKIEFLGGREYTYEHVPLDVWRDRENWDSKGKWVAQVIKPGYHVVAAK